MGHSCGNWSYQGKLWVEMGAASQCQSLQWSWWGTGRMVDDSHRMCAVWYCSQVAQTSRSRGLSRVVVSHGVEWETGRTCSQPAIWGAWEWVVFAAQGSGEQHLLPHGVTMSGCISKSPPFLLAWPCSMAQAVRTVAGGELEKPSTILSTLDAILVATSPSPFTF